MPPTSINFDCKRCMCIGSKHLKNIRFNVGNEIPGEERARCRPWFVQHIVAGGRQITKICRSRAARLRNARGRARAHRPPLESCTFPCVQNSIFKNLENQALLPTETLSRLYTIINNINILFSKSSVLPSPRWTHSWHENLSQNGRIRDTKSAAKMDAFVTRNPQPESYK